MMVRNIVERVLGGLMYDTPGDEGGGGGNLPANENRVPDNNGANKPGDGDSKPTGNVKPDAGGKQPVEDPRIKGLLADLKKEREARQKFERDHVSTAAELEKERKRVRALSGLDNPSKEDEDEALVRGRLEKLYPWLKGMSEEKLQALDAMNGQVEEIRAATTHTWTTHAQKMLTSVTSGVEKVVGGKLSERQRDRVERAYVEEAKADPTFMARHKAGDPKLVDEFVKGWLDDFYEPGRRQAQAADVGRRPRVPSGKDRSILGTDSKPIDVKDDKAVADFLVGSFRAKGGQFGRR